MATTTKSKASTTKQLKVTNKAFNTTGRRKSSVARVFMMPGKGRFEVNGKPLNEFYHDHTKWFDDVISPLVLLDLLKKFDIKSTVKGGGVTGQAGALKLAIARAIDEYELSTLPKDAAHDDRVMHKSLRQASMLTRDSREVLRKLPGLVKARKAKQFSKR